jgi:hypothetical protein
VISGERSAIFGAPLVERRRRGPRRRVADRVPTSVKIPPAVFDALCRRATKERLTLHKFMLRTLASAVSTELR